MRCEHVDIASILPLLGNHLQVAGIGRNVVSSETQTTVVAFGQWRDQSLNLGTEIHRCLSAETDDLIVVADIASDPRFTGSPIVDPELGVHLVAYAPIKDPEGKTRAILFAMDAASRSLDISARTTLAIVADLIGTRFAGWSGGVSPEAADQFRDAIESYNQIAWTASTVGEVETISAQWSRITRLSAEESRGAGWANAVHPADRSLVDNAWSISVVTGRDYDIEYRVTNRSNRARWIRARAVLRRDETGQPVRWFGLVEDIHDRKVVERRLQHALHVGGLDTWELDPATGVLTASESFASRVGASDSQTLSTFEALLEFIHPEDRPSVRAAVADAWHGINGLEIEFRVVWRDRTLHWLHMSGQLFDDNGADLPFLVRLSKDVTAQRRGEQERQAMVAKTAYLGYHDPLTGLANRRLLIERLDTALPLTTQEARLALLSIDLDQFKSVNDILGHSAGDQLLIGAANRLTECVRSRDFIARFGGDEFVVVIDDLKSIKEVEHIAGRIVESLGQPFDLGAGSVVAGGSVGISIAPDDTLDVKQLMRNADTALYRAKESGRGSYRFFEPEMDQRRQTLDILKFSLRDAMVRDELELLYQPIVDLATGRTASFEALMRWHHPVFGTISPAVFIPLAETTGWIIGFGRWAIQEACRQAKTWPSSTRVSVNLSPKQLEAGTLRTDVAEALNLAGLTPDRLELEITERVLIDPTTQNTGVLSALRSDGIHIAMDDFGTGYSSLSYLRRFPFDAVKLDRSIMHNLPDGDGGDVIARAAITLGSSLRIGTTAEGIETDPQLELVRAAGCRRAQGYLFSKPVPAQETQALANHVWLEPAV